MNQTKEKTRSEKDTVGLPPRMQDALEQYRKRVWIIKLAEGTLAAIFGIMISYLVVFGLDRLFDTPTLLRVLILLTGMVGMVFFLPLKYYNWVWRHRSLEGIARLLQHKFPRFGNHVLGIVELASNRSDTSASPALVEAAMRQVDAEVAKHNLADAVPNPRHRRWAWAAGVPIILVVIGILVIPATSRNTLARWLTPWRNVERYTFAQLEGNADRRVVAYAEPFDVETRLKEDSPWKPESGEARYADQTPIVAERDGASYKFQLPPQTKEGSVALRVGDARRSIPVEPKLRPALKDLTAKVQLPDYLQRQEPRIDDVRGGIVNLVKGSAATLEATTTRELSEATLNNRPQKVEGARVTTEPISVETTTEMHLTWRDRFGLAARDPQVLRFEALNDEAPTVALSKLKNNQVVISNEVLAFEIQAADDFGVKRIGLEWEGIRNPIHNPEPSSGEKIVSAGTPTADTLTVAATFSPKRESVKPQSLRLRAYAEDYLPNRDRIYSSHLVLHVLTPSEHFKWLVGQMQLWTGAAKDVHDKELQLHQINRELRDLPPETLDDPAQRKRIQEQAAAERANAARLDSLVETGTELVQEAAKNEEFDAEQLEAWGDIIEQLDEIAGQRMPSVADLLSRAAEAPGAPAEPASTGEPTDSEGQGGQAAQGQQSSSTEGEPNDSAKVEKYGPDSILPPESLDEIPEDPNKPGKGVSVNRSKPPQDGKPGFTPANPTPTVSDVESGFNKGEDAAEGQAPQVVGGLRIPTTMLKGSGRNNEKSEDEEAPAPQAADLVLEAVEEQQELLDAFAKLADEMSKLLVSFENSTFVKRLKAASRKQIDIAVDLNNLDSFGLDRTAAENNQSDRERLAERETNESEAVSTIIQDMVAYSDRRPSPNYLRVLSEMQDALAPNQIQDIAKTINKNFVGQSTIEAEFWADTLDRWAEQLVDPLPDGPPPEGGMMELPNLPPEIVLEVLRIIDREIQLREETRELEQAKEAITTDAYTERSIALYDTQITLTEDTREVAAQISLLPNAEERLIQQQLAKVTAAADVMDEVEDILAEPDTGPKAIAAITEVIEILLQTCRIPNTPPITTAPPATAAALMLMGIGDDTGTAFLENRSPRQATGKAGRVLPEEFRQGLDAYFNVLEGR
ncbi:hypothetical protein F4009_02950 [Candidatus Poribacteria bacterium]|nr:hypothetical protein [Candidatus Poribacteria bacterium]MYH83290.1 hypothetical protein [Candidatus Poribacteria bacterium]MYK92956.1 hypothetical protein [Candidatus Poribacteria bacterium]